MLKKCVELLVESFGLNFVLLCDVIDEVLIDVIFDVLKEVWGMIDFVVYVVVFLDKNEFDGCYVDMSFENF